MRVPQIWTRSRSGRFYWQRLASACLLSGWLIVSSGCKERRSSPPASLVSGTQSISPTAGVQYCYVVQSQGSGENAAPQFAVVWKARVMGSISSDATNHLTAINDRPIRISSSRPAIYLLDAQYQLQHLDLPEDDVQGLLDTMQKAGAGRASLWDDSAWLRLLDPHLIQVDASADSRRPLTGDRSGKRENDP